MSKFQIIILSVFGFAILAGLALLATYRSSNSTTDMPEITVWGTLPSAQFQNLLGGLSLNHGIKLKISYVEKKASTFNNELIQSLASGVSPDAVLAPSDIITAEEDKYSVIPFTAVSLADYRNTFVEASEIFLTSKGTMAIPFVIDPLVMYWNRDMLTNAGISNYPVTWADFENVINKVIVKDTSSNIQRTAIALGEFRNINNAKEIFSTLLFQAGDPITARGVSASGVDEIYTVLNTDKSQNALTFFTDFSNPAKKAYSWNRSLPVSKNYFIAGKLATYFGFASEYPDIRAKNPNLNFDIAPFPQIKDAARRVTYGKVYAFAIPKMSKNPAVAFQDILNLVDIPALTEWQKVSYLPSIRRDMIAGYSGTDQYMKMFNDSALIAKGWLDPDYNATTQILQNISESYQSGKASAGMIFPTARGQIDALFKKNQLIK